MVSAFDLTLLRMTDSRRAHRVGLRGPVMPLVAGGRRRRGKYGAVLAVGLLAHGPHLAVGLLAHGPHLVMHRLNMPHRRPAH
jgi:hypothetical protein